MSKNASCATNLIIEVFISQRELSFPAATAKSSLSVETTDWNNAITLSAKRLVKFKINVNLDPELIKNSQKRKKLHKNYNKIAKPYGLHITAFHMVFFYFIILYLSAMVWLLQRVPCLILRKFAYERHQSLGGKVVKI